MLLTRQTDLAQAESTEMAAQADEARAQTELDRATGRLLQTRGIEIGQEPRR
jgi:outer membrane protein TolC